MQNICNLLLCWNLKAANDSRGTERRFHNVHAMSADNSQKNNSLSSNHESLLHSTPIKESKNENQETDTSEKAGSEYQESFESSSRSVQISEDKTVSDSNSSIIVNEATSTLSAWEEWLLKKEKEKRKQLHKIKSETKQKQIQEQRRQEKENQKKILAAEARKKWLKEVEENERKQLREEKEKFEKEKRNKEEKDKLIRERSQQKFKDWKLGKEKVEEEIKKKQEEEKKNITEQIEQKKKLNDEAFKKWKEEVAVRPKSQNCVGYGYTGGVLTSYYDASSPPVPSYCNPDPWIPNDP